MASEREGEREKEGESKGSVSVRSYMFMPSDARGACESREVRSGVLRAGVG